MRTIGNLESEQSASRFSNSLYVKGIENQIEGEEDGQYSVWVIEDDQLGTAAELLKRYRADPGAAEFVQAEALAREKRRKEDGEKETRSTVADEERLNYERNFSGPVYIPMILIIISVAVAIYSRLGMDIPALRPFFISEYFYSQVRSFSELPMAFHEILGGQIWRPITPIFIHFSFPHLLFNAMMLHDLGALIERRFGARHLLLLILVTALVSNVAQALWHGPLFGGLSGVDYGLFGFLWIRGKFDPEGSELSKNTVTLLLVWLVLGYTGILKELIGNVANAAHTAGLLVGMAWGYLSTKRG